MASTTTQGWYTALADVTQVDKLLHGEESYVCADAGYTGVEKRPEHAGREVVWSVASRRSTYKSLGKRRLLGRVIRQIKKAKAQKRAKVEHPFRVIKCQFGYTKVRFRGLAKNTAQLVTLIGFVVPLTGYTRGPHFNLDRSMNKSELIAAISASADLPKTTATAALDALTAAITGALQQGESVTLVGFGTFEVKQRAAREGRNPQTGAALQIAAAKLPCFKPGKGLKDALN